LSVRLLRWLRRLWWLQWTAAQGGELTEAAAEVRRARASEDGAARLRAGACGGGGAARKARSR
jgi:hypothetical protein